MTLAALALASPATAQSVVDGDTIRISAARFVVQLTTLARRAPLFRPTREMAAWRRLLAGLRA
ncbi:hypothetical protein [Reyranella sp.]|uniref:hypothetical protein n=1 Tax=Reyranella sp. TaxID=1929291 RepID=UPI003F7122B8